MPLSANNNLDELYTCRRVVVEEILKLEEESEGEATMPHGTRGYILQVTIRALREEAARLDSSISDILDRDLAR